MTVVWRNTKIKYKWWTYGNHLNFFPVEQVSFWALRPLAEPCKSLRLLWLLLSLLSEFREDHVTGPNSPSNTNCSSHRGTISTKSTLQPVNHSGQQEKLLHHPLSQHTTLLTMKGISPKNVFINKNTIYHPWLIICDVWKSGNYCAKIGAGGN